MITEPVTITIDPESELGRALERAGARPSLVCLEVNGVRYRVSPEDPFAHYDPEQVRVALRESAGAFKGVDVEALIRDLREQR